MAVLDDPAARGPDAPFRAEHWTHRVYYAYGESCGVGYQQGRNSPETVLGAVDLTAISADNLLINLTGITDRLSKGDVTVHSTLSAYGVHCNPIVSIETTMMIKEHLSEQYGLVEAIVGTNGSGAALQQYNAANNAPGLLAAAMPTATFADINTDGHDGDRLRPAAALLRDQRPRLERRQEGRRQRPQPPVGHRAQLHLRELDRRLPRPHRPDDRVCARGAAVLEGQPQRRALHRPGRQREPRRPRPRDRVREPAARQRRRAVRPGRPASRHDLDGGVRRPEHAGSVATTSTASIRRLATRCRRSWLRPCTRSAGSSAAAPCRRLR